MADEDDGAVHSIGNSDSFGKESSLSNQYRLGFLECLSEVMHFLVDMEGFPASGALCLSLDAHLRNHCASLLQDSPLPSTKSECVLDEESHYQMEMQQKKSLEHSSIDIPASEGEEMESIMQGNGCHDCEAYHPREYRVMLSRKEQERNGGEAPALPLQQSAPEDRGGGASYKFKSNIKRRFTAGLEKRRKFEEDEDRKCAVDGGDESTSAALTNNLASSLMAHAALHLPGAVQPLTKCRTSGNHLPYVPDAADYMAPRIPVFALHAEHSFYVPLMLDPSTLAQHAPLLSKHASSALHPVTISVNFCSGGECLGGRGEQRQGGCPPPQLRDFQRSTSPPPPTLMESMCKQNYRHWSPADISQ